MFSILPKDQIDRWIDQPLFEFRQDADPALDRADSVVWRRVARENADVHNLGCAQQKSYYTQGKNKKYTGFRSANVGILRAARTSRGIGFIVVHYPKDGAWHAHLQISSYDKLLYDKKYDRRDIQSLIEEIFSVSESHDCAE
jgi:hypothetical protein